MKLKAIILICSTTIATPLATAAMQLDFPANASMSNEEIITLGSYKMPISAWQNSALQTIATNGEITRQAWKISASDLTTLQILGPLKQQLISSGFEIIFECETQGCGGFDFRYSIETMPEPDMHVDLGDFRFLSAKNTAADQPEFVSLLISRTQNAGYVQLTRVGVAQAKTTMITSTKNPFLTNIGNPEISLDSALENQGHFILEDLVFQTGSSELGGGDFASLASLANYLKAHPTRTVALVGHTDAEGSLNGNIALSKKRARSVVKQLVSKYNVDKTQLSAEGNGFLSPRASNLTEGGRAQNRRVEVIVTSTQ